MSEGKVNWVHVGVALVIGMGLAVGYLTLRNQTRPAPIEILPPPTATPLLPTATPGPFSVFINGAVNAPGVYQLPAGSRVLDALDAAGGFSAEADPRVVNLAAPLRDGLQLFVPTQGQSGEMVDALVLEMSGGFEDEAGGGGDSAETSSGAIDANGIVNINLASRADLETLPGVGESTAQNIVSYREDNGPFPTIEDIMNVPGIGEGKFEEMQNLIRVDQ